MRKHFPASIVTLGGVLSLVGGLGVACLDRMPPLAPDTTPPAFTLLSPIDTMYDLDGDGFLDLSLTWQDSGGAVNASGVVLRSLDGLNGSAPLGANLVDVWTVETRNAQSLLVHETLENLLHGGVNRLEITIPDTAGNVMIDTISFVLPHGKFLKTLVTGLTSSVSRGIGIVYCDDDGLLYMAAGRNIVVAQPDSLQIIEVVRHSSASDDLQHPVCVQGDPILYVTDLVERFDRQSRTWLPRVPGSFGSVGIAVSRLNPAVLYVGESNTGSIGVIDRVQNVRIGSFLPFDSTSSEFVFDIAVLTSDTKLYATRYSQGGILVADPRNGEVLRHVGVGGSGWPDSGRTDNIALSWDDAILYVAVLDGNPRGVWALNTAADTVVARLPLTDYVPQALALSPSGKRLFVTTQDRFPSFPSKNVLVDIQNWTILQEFERPRPLGELRIDGGISFHSSGKLAFVCHNLNIDVYLLRE